MKNMTVKKAGARLACVAFLIALAVQSPKLLAQAAAQRFVGTITSISGDTLTVKTDAGESHQVQVPDTATLKRIAPGQKDLSTAETIKISDLATGDRVLVKLDPDATGGAQTALQVVAVKQVDIAQRQQQEMADWQRNGVGGLVKSVDAAGGVVMVTSGAGSTAKTVTVHISKNTVLKRYAPNSIRFADAQTAPLDAVKVGDQFRARGQKNADGTEINATEAVSGSFRNISGTVSSVDAANSTVTVKDLATKKNVTVRITPEAEMRRLPDMMARMIAARLKGTVPPNGGGAMMAARTQGGSAQGSPTSAGGGHQAGTGAGGFGAGRRGNGDMEQVLERAPSIKLGDLQKGEAVMLVSTEGANDVTAIKFLAGVEPLLESPEASRNLLANWSMGGGGGGEEGGGATQ
ncbi:MAG TPA: DUF5666 domain-containing protein [Terracidiphilus sp.]|nr:DUF5666 domain-containing protein [Terracidiphilus sp.]